MVQSGNAYSKRGYALRPIPYGLQYRNWCISEAGDYFSVQALTFEMYPNREAKTYTCFSIEIACDLIDEHDDIIDTQPGMRFHIRTPEGEW